MYNPYENASFESQIIGVTHAHCKTQFSLNRLYNGGVRHFAISNYYPSEPIYPLGSVFDNVPVDAISCPNAEFAHFIQSPTSFHMNGLGSTWAAGNETETSPNIGWRESVTNILENLLYADAGGVTINHPIWSKLPFRKCLEVLDFDDRVLGIEILNASTTYLDDGIALWDKILATGRRCFGFCVPDHHAENHDEWVGRESILANADNYSCLKAYRKGAFYSRINNTDLQFTSNRATDSALTVTTANAESIRIITNTGTYETQGNSASYTFKRNDVYARAEASNNEDRIFANAITLKERKKKRMLDLVFWLA